MQNMAKLIDTWGRAELAKDLGVPKERVRGWRRHDVLPPKYWKRLLEKAPARNIKISPDLLIDIAARD